jgi:hypothetical protein
MDGIVGSLRLGWEALLLKEEAYEEMGAADNPVVKGLILIVIVGVIVALCAMIGDILEWASTPNLNELRDTVFYYLTQMPWWNELAREPGALEGFEQMWKQQWTFASMASPNPGGAILNVIVFPIALIVRWLIYGLLAYLFARWLGGTAGLSETLGVLALAVAPQALYALNLFPFVQMGNIITIWAIFCAYIGLKTVHKLRWNRAMYATLLPYVLVIGVLVLAGCFGSAVFAVAVKGGS